jgi:hypothetical protein
MMIMDLKEPMISLILLQSPMTEVLIGIFNLALFNPTIFLL